MYPRIALLVEDIEFTALVDTGACRSLISDEIVKMFKGKYVIDNSENVELYDASGNRMKLKGKIKLKVRYQDYIMDQEFIIMEDMSRNCIMGMDAIEKHEFVINGKEKTIYRSKLNGKNTGEVMLTTTTDVEINPFEMLPCFVQNEEEIDLEEKEVINSIFGPKSPPEEKGIGNVEPEGGKEILFKKALECPPDIEIIPIQIKLGVETKQVLYMINTSCKKIQIKPWEVMGEVALVQLAEVKNKTFAMSVNSVDATKDISLEGIPENMKIKVKELISEFEIIFAKTSYDIKSTDLIEHVIETNNDGPLRHRPYRTPFKLQDEMRRHLDEMVKHGIIRESSSPWAAPVILVKKPNTTETRLVVDYRSLNKITKHDSFPLPNVNSILDQLGSKKVFSTIDLASGFFQIPMEKKSIEKTAFICEQGLYEYLRTPMGLKNSPSTMNRLLLRIFRNLIGKTVLVYMDDVLVMSNSVEEHIAHLREVFAIFKSANLKIKAKKCSFMLTKVTFLGHVITPEGRQPNPKTVEKIINFKAPTTLKELQSFIGLCSYYRAYVKKFSDIAHPLIELTKKGDSKGITWNDEAQCAFDRLKKHLTSQPILAHPLFDEEFILQTDASGHSLGAVLSQIQKGREVAIAYASRHLNTAEKKYASIEREALAIIFGIRHFKHYLLDNPFTIETDCRPLLWLENIKETDSGRLQRWAISLSSMKYKIKYKEGKVHRNADFLSRLPIAVVEESPREKSTIKNEQANDPLCRDIRFYIENGRLRDNSNKFPEWLSHINLFKIREDILLHEFRSTSLKRAGEVVLQVVLPKTLRKAVVQEYHDKANHFAFQKTYLNIRKHYYWPKMAKEIQEYCKGCITCATTKKHHTAIRPLLKPIDIARGPFDVISLDFMGPFRPKSRQGNSYIMVSTCLFSKYVDCVALPEISAMTTAKALVEKIFYQHGAPRCILSDRGSQFTSKLFKHLLNILKIEQRLTTAWHPQCNGQTERANKTLCQIIRGYINDKHDNWEDLLEPIKFAYVNSVNTSTNFSPYFLTHGRDPVLLIDQIMNAVNAKILTPQDYVSKTMENLNRAYNMVRANLVQERRHQKEQYDKRAKEMKYCIGDKVLLDLRGVVPQDKCKKFLPKYEGPYRVLKVYENGTVEITAEGVTKHVNMKRIIPLYETMIWQDEECPELSPVPRGTQQFNKQSQTKKVRWDLPENLQCEQEVEQGDTDVSRQATQDIVKGFQGQGHQPRSQETSVENSEVGLKAPGGLEGQPETSEFTTKSQEDAGESSVTGGEEDNKEGYRLRNRKNLKQPDWLKDFNQSKEEDD